MHIISHKFWGLAFILLLLNTYQLIAQCPLTKSLSIQVTHPALPNFDLLEPADFFVHPEESEQYTDLAISQDQFVCIDLGIRAVHLSGHSAAGVPFSCNEFVWVYDTMNICNTVGRTSLEVIGGKIRTEAGEPVENVTIGLTGNNVNYFKGSDERGFFLFEDFDPIAYEVKPTKNDDIRNGITTRDLIVLQRHILGILPIESPYKLIASDLNNSGNISAFDMVLLRQVLLAIREEFPNNQSWRFVNAGFEFTNPTNPFADEIPSSYLLNPVSSPHLNNSFIAIKIGDLDNSATSLMSAAPRAIQKESATTFTIENRFFEKGDNINAEFQVNKKLTLSGLQFSLQYDPSIVEFVEIESGLDLHFHHTNGVIHISWTTPFEINLEKGIVPLKFVFRALHNGQLNQAVQLSKRGLAAEVYERNEVLPFQINWKNSLQMVDFQSFNNFPNPFNARTTLPFKLPERSQVQLLVFDNKGIIILQKNQQFDEGNNAFEIEGRFGASGVYFYQITSDFGTTNGKMNYLVR